MSQSATTSIIALNMKRGGGGVRTIYYSTNTNSWDGRGSGPYITVLLPILEMGGGS